MLWFVISSAVANTPGMEQQISGPFAPAYDTERKELVNDTIPWSARLLSKYVQIESVTGNERRAGQFLDSLSREYGLYVRLFTDEIDSYNFAASLFPLEQGKPNVVFLNHIDVVPAGEDSLWQHPPFSGAIADGYVWGRGAIDNKAMGIMQLLALASFKETEESIENLPYNFTMLAVSNEEKSGMKGTGLIVEHFLDELNPVVVYGEGGTGLTGIIQAQPDMPMFGIETAQKNGLWFSIRASDPESGHGSVPRDRYPAKQIVNAASSFLEQKQPIILTPPAKSMLREIGRHERGLRKLALRNIGFFRHFIGRTLRSDPFTNALLTNTVTLTNLGSSEGAFNQVAHSAWAVFDCRLLPGIDHMEFLEAQQKHFGELFDEIEIIAHAPQSGISDTGIYYDALAEAVTTVFGDVIVTPILFPAHNDNSFFRKKGIPAYGLLPSLLTLELIESIHNIDERIGVESVDQGVAVYNDLINNLLKQNNRE